MPTHGMNKTVAVNYKGNIFASLKKLAAYSRRYLPFMIVSIILAMVSACLSLYGPNQIQEVTNLISQGTIQGNMDLEKIVSIFIILLIIYVSSAVLSYIQHSSMNVITNLISKNLRQDINVKINKVPLKFIDGSSTGDILSIVTNDVDLVSQGLNSSIAALFASVTLLLGCVIMMFVTNYILAFTAILSTFAGFLLMLLIMQKSQKYFLYKQNMVGKVNGVVEEIYSNHSIVRVSNGQKENYDKFSALNENLYQTDYKSSFLSMMMQPLMAFIGNFGYAMVCIIGGILMFYDLTDIGTIIAFIMYTRLFSSPLSQIAQAFNYLQQTAAASDRIFKFLEVEELEDESYKTTVLSKENLKGDVEFDHIQFGYDPGKIIIKDFSLKIGGGKKIAIVGPTGAGKTTLVNLLMRFYELNSGQIKIDDVSLKDVTRENVHELFGMVLQDTWLFKGTIRENLKYNNDVTDEDMIKASKTCGVHHFIMTLPQGYDTILDDSLNISSGQKQLLTITRAMIQNAPMLILDEATSSVDTRTELIIQKAMDELTKNRTSFVIAHRLSTIKNADLILVMKDGNIIEQGNHEELLKQNGFYATLYNSQFQEV